MGRREGGVPAIPAPEPEPGRDRARARVQSRHGHGDETGLADVPDVRSRNADGGGSPSRAPALARRRHGQIVDRREPVALEAQPRQVGIRAQQEVRSDGIKGALQRLGAQARAQDGELRARARYGEEGLHREGARMGGQRDPSPRPRSDRRQAAGHPAHSGIELRVAPGANAVVHGRSVGPEARGSWEGVAHPKAKPAPSRTPYSATTCAVPASAGTRLPGAVAREDQGHGRDRRHTGREGPERGGGPPVDRHAENRHRKSHAHEQGVLDAGAGPSQADGERPFAGRPVRLEVPHVVGDQNRRVQRADADAGQDGLPESVSAWTQ